MSKFAGEVLLYVEADNKEEAFAKLHHIVASNDCLGDGRVVEDSIEEVGDTGNGVVFFDSGGGDIYAGRSREQCRAQIAKDVPDYDADKEMFEVSGNQKAKMSNGQMGSLIWIAAGLNFDKGAFLIASDNC